MKCLVDARAGSERDAVGVCTVCGMGLCVDHLIEREVPLVKRGSGWASETAMVILCERCAEAQSLTA